MSIQDRQLVFGGAGPGTPWGTLGLVVGRALAPHGYDVRVEAEASRDRNPRLLSDGKVDLGGTTAHAARWAYQGKHTFAGEAPRRNLRLIATIMHPAWLGIAVRAETWITDLGQIRERQLPVRVIGGRGALFEPVWAHYGLSRALIESWGGAFYSMPPRAEGAAFVPGPWARTGEFDVIMEPIYAAFTLEQTFWYDASILHNLRFLGIPDELLRRMCADLGGEPGFIPFRLYRGVTQDTPSLYRPWQVIYTRDDCPDDFVYLLARALDEGRHLFRQTHLPFSYDPKEVARDNGLPLHPGAARYYREMNYPISAPAA
jgi:TRAP-type uncharacterized transport system substrate-binding protein